MTAAAVEFWLDLLVGLSGGASSGLLGVSPGGALTVFSALLMGAEQHVAQGLSLIAQIPPTGLAGLKCYREAGGEIPRRWLAPLILGFVAGGFAGAAAAVGVSAVALRWIYVAYLVALDVLLILRRSDRQEDGASRNEGASLARPALFAVGGLAGLSSGFLGIGGGLAIVAGLGAPQRRAQMVALALTLLPMTAPAAYVYWRAGWAAPWPALVGAVAGLWAGADLGARAAQRVSERALRRLVVGFVAAMALAMAAKTLAW